VEQTKCAFIGLGSNVGDGIAILKAAWDRIGRIEGVQPVALSQPYLTAPVDMESSKWFTNAVGGLRTALKPRQLLEHLHRIETIFGRKRDAATTGYQDRSLDLDILSIEKTVVNTPELVLPHPRLEQRLFVLLPFTEIAPYYREQPDGKSIAERYARLLELMQAGRVSRQEIKKGRWEE
jgi:2-amino-4-hydroxy-6-hydroxymethyldihydropteridine diphosphokinase